MVIIDFIILGVVLLTMLVCFFVGFARTTVFLASWILAFILSISLADKLAILLSTIIDMPELQMAAAYVLMFVLTLIMGGLASFLLRSLIEKTGLTSTNRMLGAMLGMVLGIIIVCGFVMFAGLTKMPEAPWWTSSVWLPYFVTIVEWILPLIPTDFSRYVSF